MPLALPFKPGAEMVAASPTSKPKSAGFCTLKSQRGCPVTASIAYSVLSGSAVPNRATPCVPVASGEKAVVTHVPAWPVRKVWNEKICEQSLALSATASPLFTLPSLVPVYTVSTPPGGVAIIGLASMLAISFLEQSVFPVAPLKAVTVAPYALEYRSIGPNSRCGSERISQSQIYAPKLLSVRFVEREHVAVLLAHIYYGLIQHGVERDYRRSEIRGMTIGT